MIWSSRELYKYTQKTIWRNNLSSFGESDHLSGNEGVCSVTQLCMILCDPPGSTVQGIFQAKILEWVVISFSRGSFWPGDRTASPASIPYQWATREAFQLICKTIGNLTTKCKHQNILCESTRDLNAQKLKNQIHQFKRNKKSNKYTVIVL